MIIIECKVVLIGQTVASVAQIFLLGVSPNVAAVWFGADQVSLACSIGVFGNQVQPDTCTHYPLLILTCSVLDRCGFGLSNTSNART